MSVLILYHDPPDISTGSTQPVPSSPGPCQCHTAAAFRGFQSPSVGPFLVCPGQPVTVRSLSESRPRFHRTVTQPRTLCTTPVAS
eukprot:54387-Hanusia_phi.AAC.1